MGNGHGHAHGGSDHGHSHDGDDHGHSHGDGARTPLLDSSFQVRHTAASSNSLTHCHVRSSRAQDCRRPSPARRRSWRPWHSTTCSRARSEAGPQRTHFPAHRRTGLLPRIKQIIEEEGIDANSRDGENITALHWAAINNRVACLECVWWGVWV